MKNSFILLLILTACTAAQTESQTPVPIALTKTPLPSAIPTFFIGDGGVITGQPCAAPCFLGIRIGETSLDQVIPLLEDKGISSCSQDDDPKILCGTSIVVGANNSTAIVDSIGYYPSRIVTIEEIIQAHGVPDVVHVIPSGIPEAPKTVMLFFFDILKMRVRLPEVDGINYVVSTSGKIELINYFDNALYSKLKDNMFSQPWKGYSTYEP